MTAPLSSLGAAIAAEWERLCEEYPDMDREERVLMRRQVVERVTREWWRSLDDAAHFGRDVTESAWRSALALDRPAGLRLRSRWLSVREVRDFLAARRLADSLALAALEAGRAD